MKKLALSLSLLIAWSLIATCGVWAEGFGTPTMDGIPDGVYGASEASDPNTDGGGNDNMDLLNLYVCNDATYWYFCFTIDDDIGATNWGKYVIYIDVDGMTGSGATSDAWTRSVTSTDPHLPEYGLYSWVDSPPYDPNHTQFWIYSGGWSMSGGVDAAALNAAVPSGIEWKLDKSRIGSPDSLWCEVWSTGGGDSDNARDTSNDPPDDWNGPEGVWDSLAVIDLSTLVHYVTGADTSKPQVLGAIATDSTHVDVTFNEAMDTTSATDPSNYSIFFEGKQESLTVTGADMLVPNIVQLTTDQQTPGVFYYLEVSSAVTDLAANGVDPFHSFSNFIGFGVAQVTFIVADTADNNFSDGYKFKGSWDTNQPHAYDPSWGLGQLYDMYDDGTNGDDVPGDHIWKRTLQLVIDGGANNWEWGVTTLAGDWIDGNWQFMVVDISPQSLTYIPPALTEQDVAVVFSVDMSAETVIMPVIISGDTEPLNWDWSVNNPDTLNDEGVNGDVAAGDDIWSITLVFPLGTRKRVEYKFGNGGADNDLPFGVNRIFFIDDVNHSVANPQVLPADTFGILTGVEPQNHIGGMHPKGFALLPNYPNPFNPETVIGYRLNLEEPTHVSLMVFNLLGQQVRTLMSSGQSSGEYQVIWDGRDDAGIPLASGVYFLRLQVGTAGQTRKMVLTR
ncbi:MAG: hypothetical protein AMJ92_10840 [candidate division Zixibacteria bacterium SM23_81]|nr:MAG: hypothetical protein AMJ92_10840 [candidate division Zixibacteria bacterium SM23_81]